MPNYKNLSHPTLVNTRFPVFKQYSKGFTLIELLISITIISVLMSAAVITYRSIQQKGRDAKRQSDLKVIQGGLQQYYADNGYYPVALSIITSPVTYLKTLPTDPSSSSNYLYVPAAGCDNVSVKCYNYCLGTSLENTANAPTSQCSVSGGNYGVAAP